MNLPLRKTNLRYNIFEAHPYWKLHFDFEVIRGVIGTTTGWVRLFGRGIGYKDVTKYSLLFSQRQPSCRKIQVGKWFVHVLPDSIVKLGATDGKRESLSIDTTS